MRTMSSDLLRRTFQRFGSGDWTWAYRIVIDENWTTLQRTVFQLTPWAEEIVLDGRTYYPAPITHARLESNSNGTLPTIEVGIHNANQQASKYVMYGDGYRNKLVTIHGLCVQGAASGAVVTIPAICRTVGIQVGDDPTERAVTLSCEIGAVLSDADLPRKVFDPRRCRHAIYGRSGARCGMIVNGSTPLQFMSCPRTWVACNERAAWMESAGLPKRLPARYGGQPGIPLQRTA